MQQLTIQIHTERSCAAAVCLAQVRTRQVLHPVITGLLLANPPPRRLETTSSELEISRGRLAVANLNLDFPHRMLLYALLVPTHLRLHNLPGDPGTASCHIALGIHCHN